MQNKAKLMEQISEYIDWCKNIKMMSEETIPHKLSDLMLFAEFTNISRIEEIGNNHINEFMKAQHLGIHRTNGRPCSNRTINTRTENIKAMLKYFRDMGLDIPGLKLPLLIKLREDPPAQLYYERKIINHVLCFADRRSWLMIRLAFECGLRLNELRTLQLKDIDGLTINIGSKAKCKEDGIMTMSEVTKARLNDWIEREGITNYIFRGKPDIYGNERALSKSCVRRCMTKPFLQAGLDGFHPHALRHSFATEIIENGATDEEAQHMLRHSSFEVSRNYIHRLGVRTKRSFEKYMHCKDDEDLR